jgi:hypothetical protein
MCVRPRPPHRYLVLTALRTIAVSTWPHQCFLRNAGARLEPSPSSSPSYPKCVHVSAIPILRRGKARAVPPPPPYRSRMITAACPCLRRRRPPSRSSPRSHRAQPHPRPAPTSPSHVACRPRARSAAAQMQLQMRQSLLEIGDVAHDRHKVFIQYIVPFALPKCQSLLESALIVSEINYSATAATLHCRRRPPSPPCSPL